MLHILNSRTALRSNPVLCAMFAARKAVFVDLLKWDVPVIDGQFEADQFDDEHAVYLVFTERDGSHLGSARLLPTTRPHILGCLYPDLCREAPPRGPDVFEITRFCLDRRLNAARRRIVRDTLVTALVDHALANGIVAYSAIAELAWYRQIVTFGWRCTPLGQPRRIAGAELAALKIGITRDTPALLAAAGIAPALGLRDHPRVAA